METIFYKSTDGVTFKVIPQECEVIRVANRQHFYYGGGCFCKLCRYPYSDEFVCTTIKIDPYTGVTYGRLVSFNSNVKVRLIKKLQDYESKTF